MGRKVVVECDRCNELCKTVEEQRRVYVARSNPWKTFMKLNLCDKCKGLLVTTIRSFCDGGTEVQKSLRIARKKFDSQSTDDST